MLNLNIFLNQRNNFGYHMEDFEWLSKRKSHSLNINLFVITRGLISSLTGHQPEITFLKG